MDRDADLLRSAVRLVPRHHQAKAMPRLLIGILLVALMLSGPRGAVAGFPLHQGKPAKPPVSNPPPTVLPPPGFPSPPVYGFPQTGYPSGWYNTHYWPRKNVHYGFYGDYWQWGYFPGY